MGLAITFDYKTRELARYLEIHGIDTEKKLYFIDCISYNQGKGSPPVPNLVCLNKPDDFENLFYYTIIQLRQMDSSNNFIVIIAPNNLLEFSDYNEIGVFFKWYSQKLERQGIPIIFLYKESGDRIFRNILEGLVKK